MPTSNFIAVFVGLFILSQWGMAHPGRQDNNGGHMDRSTGSYHCHQDACINLDEGPEESFDLFDGTPAAATTIAGSWGQAKRWARDTVYAGNNITFYCGCQYTPNSSTGGEINLLSCNYEGSAVPHSNRANRLEWEHVVPASLMPAKQFACWNQGLPSCEKPGRHCCEKYDLNAKVQLFDLHNLVPSVGQTNALRSNKRYGLIEGEDLKLGSCDFEWSSDLAEPPLGRRGEVARVWLYFMSQYGLKLDESELEMYLRWSLEDRPDAWEIERNARVKEKQGNGNPYVEMFINNEVTE